MEQTMRKQIAVWTVAVRTFGGAHAMAPPMPLVDAVKAQDERAVLALLQQRADVNAAETDGTTALHWAVENNDPRMVDLLIRNHAKVNAANRYGVTPLTLAATNGNEAVADIL